MFFKKPRMKEALIQSSFFRWLSLKHPKLRKVCFAVPNGGSRHAAEAANLKRQGVTAGVPDIFCAIPNGNYHGLFIEFKAGKNKLTKLQKEMFDMLEEGGYKCITCYSTQEAGEKFEGYVYE